MGSTGLGLTGRQPERALLSRSAFGGVAEDQEEMPLFSQRKAKPTCVRRDMPFISTLPTQQLPPRLGRPLVRRGPARWR